MDCTPAQISPPIALKMRMIALFWAKLKELQNLILQMWPIWEQAAHTLGSTLTQKFVEAKIVYFCVMRITPQLIGIKIKRQ